MRAIALLLCLCGAGMSCSQPPSSTAVKSQVIAVATPRPIARAAVSRSAPPKRVEQSQTPAPTPGATRRAQGRSLPPRSVVSAPAVPACEQFRREQIADGMAPKLAAERAQDCRRALKAWPGDDVWAFRTMRCESSFDPQSTGGGGDNYFGMWQFGPWARSHVAPYGDPRSQSVEVQTQRAWSLLRSSGSGQWSCSPYSYSVTS